MTKLLRLAAIAVLLAAGCAGGNGSGASTPRRGKTVITGAMATDFSARDVDGKTVRLTDYLGKQVVLINFWATWCEPCLAEMPHLRVLYEKYRKEGFVVLAVSVDGPETVADVPSFAKRNALMFPVLVDEDSRIASVYNPKKSAPLSVLIDRRGTVTRVHEGYNPGDETDMDLSVSDVLDPAATAK